MARRDSTSNPTVLAKASETRARISWVFAFLVASGDIPAAARVIDLLVDFMESKIGSRTLQDFAYSFERELGDEETFGRAILWAVCGDSERANELLRLVRSGEMRIPRSPHVPACRFVNVRELMARPSVTPDRTHYRRSQ